MDQNSDMVRLSAGTHGSGAQTGSVVTVGKVKKSTAPVLFFDVRVPCSCGMSLDDKTYTFFPSSVFVHGTCPACGSRTAIFAPHMKDMRETLPAHAARRLQMLVQEVAGEYQESASDVVDEFLTYLIDLGTAPASTTASAETSTGETADGGQEVCVIAS